MPSRAALKRLTAGTGDRKWNTHLNEVPLIPDLVLEPSLPWYGGLSARSGWIVNEKGNGGPHQ